MQLPVKLTIALTDSAFTASNRRFARPDQGFAGFEGASKRTDREIAGVNRVFYLSAYVVADGDRGVAGFDCAIARFDHAVALFDRGIVIADRAVESKVRSWMNNKETKGIQLLTLAIVHP